MVNIFNSSVTTNKRKLKKSQHDWLVELQSNTAMYCVNEVCIENFDN
jgi:hypothetical protein